MQQPLERPTSQFPGLGARTLGPVWTNWGNDALYKVSFPHAKGITLLFVRVTGTK